MIDDKTRKFYNDIPSIQGEASSLFDIMLTCYLRGRADEAKLENPSLDTGILLQTDKACLALGSNVVRLKQ